MDMGYCGQVDLIQESNMGKKMNNVFSFMTLALCGICGMLSLTSVWVLGLNYHGMLVSALMLIASGVFAIAYAIVPKYVISIHNEQV